MTRLLALLGLLSVFVTSGAWGGQSVSVTTRDGVTVYGTMTSPSTTPRATILLFHMAGSNRGEYSTIAPRLASMGFETLAIDQRSGGAAFGRGNETIAKLGRPTGFAAALPDLEAALADARARRPGSPVFVWGSSYSAALVFVLAARHPGEIAGVLAFSPGEYMGEFSIAAAAAKVTCPVFVTSASDGGEIAAAGALLAATPATPKRQYIPTAGVHGSSTLDPGDNPRGAEANWKAVAEFLDKIAPK